MKEMTIDRELIRAWTHEVLESMGGWVDEIDDGEHMLITSLEFIDQHARHLAAQLHWVGQVVAQLKSLEEKTTIDLEALEGSISKAGKFSKVADAKAEIKSNPDYITKAKELVDVKTQRRCAEALLDAVKCKERMLPGVQGAANAIKRLGIEN